MNAAYRLFICFSLLSFSCLSYSENNDISEFQQGVFSKFLKQSKGNPQEKVYLQTDKPYYSAGEDLWFKAYLVDATTHLPNSISRFIYVELTDKSDSVIYRVKIRKDSLGFDGFIKLKPELPVGYYTLRAYSYWMQNAPSEFFFNKRIYIGNNIDDRIQSQISYQKPVNGKIPVTITLTNSSQKPISGQKVLINQIWNNAPKKKITLLSDKDGKLSWQLSIDSTDLTKKSIELLIEEGEYKCKNKFILPNFNTDFDLQFFPESGILLTNNLQTVAFKAIGTDGLSVEVTGKIFTNTNEEVTEFSSLNKGMGKFILATQPNESYYAIVKSSNGLEKRFNLPASMAEGLTLRLAYNKDKILYEIVNQTSLPINSLFMLIHARGKVLLIEPLKSLVGRISSSVLPEGILSFTIIDSLGNKYCERLSFMKHTAQPSINMLTDKQTYSKRELVNMSLKINSALGTPATGNFSISVTDNQTVKLDSLSDNIISNLWLTSDIKGYVEDPASYFTDNSVLTREKLDILMLTQGWRRFEIENVLKGKFKQPGYYMEAGQALSGKVSNILEKPSKNCDIIMLSPYKSMIRMVKTDSLGRYLISGIEFPDSTSFILKAKKRKSLTDVEIIPDADEFPKFKNYIPSPRVETTAAPIEYFRQSKDKYYYEGGIRVVSLGEVTVTAEKKKKESDSNYYSGLADSQITSETLEKYSSMSLLTVLSTIAGVYVMGDQISIRGSQGQPMLMIDNIETETTEELSYLTTNDVEEISVFKGASAAIFGVRGGNGVIAITLKKGVVSKAGVPISLASIVPLGYQKPNKFYVPKYEIDSVLQDSKPDLRTTIYWNPKLISDSTGMVNFKFYTADKANNYSVIVEGINNDGEIFRYQGIINRKENLMLESDKK